MLTTENTEYKERYCRNCGKYRQDKGFKKVMHNGKGCHYVCPLCQERKPKKSG